MILRSTVSLLATGALAGTLALAGCSSSPQPKVAASTAAMQATLTGNPWHWVATLTPVEVIAPADPSRYTLQFGDDGSASLLADCNRGRGTYTAGADRSLTLGPAATTRMMCPPGSLDTRYLQQLGNTAGYFFRGDTLYIDLKMDGGTMRFVRGPAESK